MARIIFVLDNVRSAFNVGSIFRTADGLEAEIELIGISPQPGKDSKLEKTSLSALEFVTWRYFVSVDEWNNARVSNSYTIAVEETKNISTISLFNLKIPVVEVVYIVLGHEIHGVASYLLSKVDVVVTIPMYGKKNSLNVATCAGIIGYKIKELLN